MKQGKNVDIVADIGGTNARFACYEMPATDEPAGLINNVQTLAVADFAGIDEALKYYCTSVNVKPKRLSLAVAGPVDDEEVRLTNSHWAFEKTTLKTTLHIKSLCVINDFTAQALTIPYLKKSEKMPVKTGTPKAHTPMLILGPGTGLGCSAVIPIGNNIWKALETEGGNIRFAPQTTQEIELLKFLRINLPQKGREVTSFEEILSGRGLEMLYQFFGQFFEQSSGQVSKPHQNKTAAEISAQTDSDPIAAKSVILFLEVLANYIASAILLTGGRQGVYLSGGIIHKIAHLIEQSQFHHILSNHGAYSDYVSAVPIYRLTANEPGLKGAGLALDNPTIAHRRL